MRGSIRKFILAFKQMWLTEDNISFWNIRRENVRVILTFPLVLLFFGVLFSTAKQDFTLFGMGSVLLSGLCFCVGCMLAVLIPFVLLGRFFKAAIILSGAMCVASFTLPTGMPSIVCGCLCNLSLGIMAVCSFYLFSMKLNNSERFVGLLPVCMTPNWGYMINSEAVSSLGIFSNLLILVFFIIIAFCAYALTFEKTSETDQNPKRENTRGSYWFLLYGISFIAITWLASEYSTAISAINRFDKVFVAPVTIAIAFLLHGLFRRSVWHMWNIISLLSVLGVILLWLPNKFSESSGRFLLDMMVSLYLFALFYMLSGIIKRAGSYVFHRKFMLILYIGMVVATAISGLFTAAWPQDTLIILTVFTGMVFVAVSLLSPVISQTLFLPQWVESYRKTDIEMDNSSANLLPPKRLMEDTNLTPREKEICALLLNGKTLRQISAELSIAYSTVNFHYTSLYRKLGINGRAQLFAMFVDQVKPYEEVKENVSG